MPLPSSLQFSDSDGRRLIDAAVVRDMARGAGVTPTFQAATARAGGGKALATRITEPQVLATTATAADSLLLPRTNASLVGMTVAIRNAGPAAAQVFGSDSDTINDVATATGVSQAASTMIIYKLFSYVNGVGRWFRT